MGMDMGLGRIGAKEELIKCRKKEGKRRKHTTL